MFSHKISFCWWFVVKMPRKYREESGDAILKSMLYLFEFVLVLLEGIVQIVPELLVPEHSLEFLRELASAFSLQFHYHCLFCIVGHGLLQQKSFRQMLLIVSETMVTNWHELRNYIYIL